MVEKSVNSKNNIKTKLSNFLLNTRKKLFTVTNISCEEAWEKIMSDPWNFKLFLSSDIEDKAWLMKIAFEKYTHLCLYLIDNLNILETLLWSNLKNKDKKDIILKAFEKSSDSARYLTGNSESLKHLLDSDLEYKDKKEIILAAFENYQDSARYLTEIPESLKNLLDSKLQDEDKKDIILAAFEKSLYSAICLIDKPESLKHLLDSYLEYKDKKEIILKALDVEYPCFNWIIIWYNEVSKIINFDTKKLLEMFRYWLIEWMFNSWEYNNFPVTNETFTAYLWEEPLLEFDKDKGNKDIPKPWTTKWFEESKERYSFLDSDTIKTFEKFWTNIALILLEGAKHVDKMQVMYKKLMTNINKDNQRNTILQLWEVFTIFISHKNFEIFDQLSSNEYPIWDKIKNFIDKYNISWKWKTIISLLFSSELNKLYQSWMDIDIENLCKRVYKNLVSYREVLDRYSNIPDGIRTSIWMEYEVTQSIGADSFIGSNNKKYIWEYRKRTNSNYKNDIDILSEYSWIWKWNDEIHEIATKPTDNVYLLILELKLLQELDFIDLNFDFYDRSSRSYHLTVWWEFWIDDMDFANLLQNALLIGNWWWINAWRNVSRINNYANIRHKNHDCEAVFSDNRTGCVELRSLSIDCAESMERAFVTTFNFAIWYQAAKKYVNLSEELLNKIWIKTELKSKEDLITYFRSNDLLKEKIWWKEEKIIYEFVLLCKQIIEKVKEHNENFYEQETQWYIEDWLYKEDHIRKRNNKEAFESIVSQENKNLETVDTKTYIEQKVQIWDIMKEINVETLNNLIFMNNLYIKPPTGVVWEVNAHNVFETTQVDWRYRKYNEQNKDAMKKTIFDHIDDGTTVRNWRYYIQWTSDKMIVNEIQEYFLRYNREIEKVISW